jgi:hypothetical protein
MTISIREFQIHTPIHILRQLYNLLCLDGKTEWANKFLSDLFTDTNNFKVVYVTGYEWELLGFLIYSEDEYPQLTNTYPVQKDADGISNYTNIHDFYVRRDTPVVRIAQDLVHRAIYNKSSRNISVLIKTEGDWALDGLRTDLYDYLGFTESSRFCKYRGGCGYHTIVLEREVNDDFIAATYRDAPIDMTKFPNHTKENLSKRPWVDYA